MQQSTPRSRREAERMKQGGQVEEGRQILELTEEEQGKESSRSLLRKEEEDGCSGRRSRG